MSCGRLYLANIKAWGNVRPSPTAAIRPSNVMEFPSALMRMAVPKGDTERIQKPLSY
jgi:hypothetical protein